MEPYIMSTQIICRIKRQLKPHAQIVQLHQCVKKLLNQNAITNVKCKNI